MVGLKQVAVLLSLAAAAWAQESPAGKDVHGCPVRSGAKKRNWLSWGRTLENQRTTGDAIINVQNVGDLVLEWQTQLTGNIFATPAVVNGEVYVVTDAGWVYRLVEATGAVVWARFIDSLILLTPPPYATGPPFSRTTPAIMTDRIIIGVNGPAYLLALRRDTGDLIWASEMDPNINAILTQAPTVERGVIYQGVSSQEETAAAIPGYPCCSFVGSMAAVNASTGAIIWQTYTIPLELVGVGLYSGAAIWGSAPAVDSENVYVATGNMYALPPDVATCVAACEADPASCIGQPSCVDPAVQFDAIMALNKRTGVIKWSTRLWTADAWTVACVIGDPTNCPIPTGPDFDFGQAPIIFGRDGLICAQKSGVIWSLSRQTGALKWENVAEPGGTLGGFMWGATLATDCDGSVTWIATSANSGQANVTLPNGDVITSASVIAVDALTGETKWRTAMPNSTGYAATSSTNKVAFAGSFSGRTMSAYSVQSGEILWSFQANATINCGPAIVGDRVIFGDGYNPAFNGTSGGTLYSFKLPGCARCEF